MKRKFKLITIAVFLISVFALISCADANDPVGSSSNGILRIEGNVPISGSPDDMDVSEHYVVAACGTGGLIMVNKAPFGLADSYDYFEAVELNETEESLKDVALITIIEEHNRVITLQKKATDAFGSYDISNGTLERNAITTGNTQGIYGLYSYPNSPDFPIYGNSVDLPNATMTERPIVVVKRHSAGYSRAFNEPNQSGDSFNSSSNDYTVLFPLKDFSFNEGFYFGANGYAGVSCWNMWGFFQDLDNNIAYNFISYADTPGEADQVAFANNKLYVADVHMGLQVLDVEFTDEAPVMTLREDLAYKTSSFARCVDANVHHLVVGSRGGGIYYFSLDGSGNPTFKEQLPKKDIGYVVEVRLDGDDLYVLSRELGVVKININN